MERVFVGAAVRTFEPGLPRADILVVRDRTIAAIGGRGKWDGPGEWDLAPAQGREVFDLRGMAIIPGFIDAHIHFSQMVWEGSLLDLSDVRELRSLHARLAVARKEKGPGEWIIGRRIAPAILRGITDDPGCDIGEEEVEGPFILGTADGHSALLDSKGARILEGEGVLASSPVRRVERMGRFFLFGEGTASVAWEWIEAREKAPDSMVIEEGLSLLHSRGVTGVHTFERSRDWRVLAGSEACRGGLRTAVGIYAADVAEAIGPREAFPGEGLTLGGLKIFIDGSLGSRTALLLDPYEGEASCGLAVSSPDRIRAEAQRAWEDGIGVCLHAIGDRAVRVALDHLEDPFGSGACVPPNRIEHVQLVHPDDLGRFGRLGAIASVQPAHIVGDRPLAEAAWGKRCRWAYPYRSLMESGARLAFGSDAPFGELDPLLAIRVAVTRRTGEGDPWYPEERIPVDEAFGAHTVGAATASGWGEDGGRLRAGGPADFVVLSRDPFRSEDDLERTEVVATVVGGKVVYGIERLRSAAATNGKRHSVD